MTLDGLIDKKPPVDHITTELNDISIVRFIDRVQQNPILGANGNKIYGLLVRLTGQLAEDPYVSHRLDGVNDAIERLNFAYNCVLDIRGHEILAEDKTKWGLTLQDGKIREAFREYERRRKDPDFDMGQFRDKAPEVDKKKINELRNNNPVILILLGKIDSVRRELTLAIKDYFGLQIRKTIRDYCQRPNISEKEKNLAIILGKNFQKVNRHKDARYIIEENRYLKLAHLMYDTNEHKAISERHLGLGILYVTDTDFFTRKD